MSNYTNQPSKQTMLGMNQFATTLSYIYLFIPLLFLNNLESQDTVDFGNVLLEYSKSQPHSINNNNSSTTTTTPPEEDL